MKRTDIFRKNLKELTKTKGPKQKDLARAIGVTPQELNDFLGGRRGFGDELIEAIIKVIGIPYSEMVKLDDDFNDQMETPIEMWKFIYLDQKAEIKRLSDELHECRSKIRELESLLPSAGVSSGTP